MRVIIAALVIALWTAPVFGQGEPSTVVGFSQGGAPLIVHHVGSGPRRIFMIGGQHGGPEYNTVQLVEALLAELRREPTQIPAGVTMDIMVNGNPDGVAVGSRQFLSGVDPNRNWGTADWKSDAYDSNARFVAGLGGPAPFSEQETRALAEWLLKSRPMLVINYHSAGGFMFGTREGLGGEITQAYSDATGYWVPRPREPGSGSGGSPLGYRASGTMGAWQRTVGIDGIFIELTNSWDPEVERNKAGLRAIFDLLARQLAPDRP